MTSCRGLSMGQRLQRLMRRVAGLAATLLPMVPSAAEARTVPRHATPPGVAGAAVTERAAARAASGSPGAVERMEVWGTEGRTGVGLAPGEAEA
jgi:hypothetical protein